MQKLTTPIKWIGIALIALSITCTPTTNQDKSNFSGKLDSITKLNSSFMDEGLWTGAVVLVGTPNKTVFHQAWGYTSTDKIITLTKDAIFDLASVTKPVATATAIAVCMDQGLVDLSSPFYQYLPEYKGELRGAVTILDLSRHISGFDNSKPYLNGGDIIDNILSNPPVRPAKEKYDYACINYILLGLIVENVSEEPLSTFCTKNIFEPLSMQDTKWSPIEKSDRVVKSKFTPELGVASDNPARAARRTIGNAGLFSTAEDLAKYCRMILGKGEYGSNRILSEKAIQAMNTKEDEKSPLSFGWFMDEKRNPPSLSNATINHNGWAGNSVWIDSAQQCFVIVLTNRTGEHGLAMNARIELAERVLNAMHKELGLEENNFKKR